MRNCPELGQRTPSARSGLRKLTRVTLARVTLALGPVIDGCDPSGPGQHIHSIEFAPANPHDCTETVAIVHGVHPGLGYGFGVTNTAKCQPPFNCGLEAKLTVSLMVSTNGDNLNGPGYVHELPLRKSEAYDYCVVGNHTAPNGIKETIQTTISSHPASRVFA